MLERDTSNLQFQLAADFINQTCQPVFLTGKAGTGKTTFLKYIKENTLKNTVIVAPTGVAAINAGGTTIHSFFQLPFGPFLPTQSNGGFGIDHHKQDNGTDKNSLLGRLRIQKEKRDLFLQLDLLIIDEISMVRSDTLDAIDTVLRHFRRNQSQPFGGVQVLFIGDLFQLPPVVPSEEWSLLQEYYRSPFFFDSQVLQQNPPMYIELDKIYRQNEQSFIEVLNKVRNNCLDEDALELLHTRYDPGFEAPHGENYILLTTHNAKADMVNTAELEKLRAKTHAFEAVITGDFNEKSYPAEKSLQLKVGAQVMFIKNDIEKVRRYFNGKIGVITKIEEGEIFVQCADSAESIAVEQEVWKNIRYTLNKDKHKLEEEEIGSFKQYPLRLAWAITIHKSQGLTFEKAIIDAGAAFAAGQVYVALSRCTSLQGLVLHRRINSSSVFTDHRVLAYATNMAAEEKLEPVLNDAKHSYQGGLIRSLFDLAPILSHANALQKVLRSEASSFNAEALPWAEQLTEMAISLTQVARKFQVQLQQLLVDPEMPESNQALQQRVSAASLYFIKTIEEGILATLKKLIPQTDSRPKANSYREAATELYRSIIEKLRQLQRCKDGFTMEGWVEKKADRYPNDLPFNYFQGQDYSSETSHPELFQRLKDLRNEICKADNLPIYLVASSATLNELTKYLPLSIEEISKINGFGKIKSEKYGPQFIELIKSYCDQFGLESLIHEKTVIQGKKEKKEKKKEETKETKEKKDPKETREENVLPKDTKTPTRFQSFELFKNGKTIAEIATMRNLVPSTIENHLTHFIATGELDVHELITAEKLNSILKVVSETGAQSTNPIKEKMGDDISYGEIRTALAYHQWINREAAGTNA